MRADRRDRHRRAGRLLPAERRSISSSSGRRRRWSPASSTRSKAPGIAAFGPSRGRRRARRLEGLHEGSLRPRAASRPPPIAASPTPRRRRPISPARGAPIVVKADGLAAGKGVIVAATLDEANAAVDAAFAGAVSARPAPRSSSRNSWPARRRASSRCATARPALPLAAAQDHKRVGDGDTGPEHRRHGRLFAGAGA